jgi:DNA-binding IclR family transcriptional regulator
MPASGEKYFFISSLAKGIKVLELLGEKEKLTVSGVAKCLGFNRAGSHRFLATLQDLGYVEKNENNRYQLTSKILELGMKFASRFEIRQAARPYMEELSMAFKETVNLGLFDANEILHLDKIDSREILRIDSPVGSRAPAYCTALGKAILSVLPPKDLAIYLDKVKLRPHGPNTITFEKELRRELEQTLKRGFAIDKEELAVGLCCVAAPVFDHTGRAPYAISISAPAIRLTAERLDQIQMVIKAVCRKLSEKLGSTIQEKPTESDKNKTKF